MPRPELIDIVIAPLRWLERARGWRRRALATAYLLMLGVGGLMGWRELSLWRLPNVPEPFEPGSGRVVVAEADNAIPLYVEASKRLKDQLAAKYRPAVMKGWDSTDWASASPEVRVWVEDSRPALEPWLRAADKPDALAISPDDFRYGNTIQGVQDARTLARLGLLEASRLEAAGDLAGSWRMVRAALRSSRHFRRHGGFAQQIIAARVGDRAMKQARAWARNPAMKTDLIGRAMADVEGCRVLSTTATEMIRAEYRAARYALANPDEWPRFGLIDDSDWTNHMPAAFRAKLFFTREPERSLRVLRLITTGYLAQCERPRAIRPKLMFTNHMIFDVDAKTPVPLRRITPESLKVWAEGSAFKGLDFNFNYAQVLIDGDRPALDALLLDFAQQAYFLDHGKPARTYAELVGPHLKALPDGVEPGDPVVAPGP